MDALLETTPAAVEETFAALLDLQAITLHLLYRDASNHKQATSVTLICDVDYASVETELHSALDEGSFLLPGALGLQHAAGFGTTDPTAQRSSVPDGWSAGENWAWGEEQDHPWHELSDVTVADASPTTIRDCSTLSAFVNAVRSVGACWDEAGWSDYYAGRTADLPSVHAEWQQARWTVGREA